MMSMEDLLRELIPLFSNSTMFGPGRFIRVSPATDDERGTHLASHVNFFSVDVETEADIEEIKVMVKKPVMDDSGTVLGARVQFVNEVNMYKFILPALGLTTSPLFPKFFFGETSVGGTTEKDILILEDLRHCGFRLADDIFLNFDQISIALTKLGEFHGSSYKLKKDGLERIHLCGELLQVPDRPMETFYSVHFDTALYRGFKSLLASGTKDDIVHRAYSKMTRKIPTLQEWIRLKKPSEPFAVITHGDFNRNNLFFKSDERGNVEVKFFDFGTALYSDPSVDLSFFLYMNTSEQMRAHHWDEFFDIYWEGLISVEPDPGFSFEEFLNNFAEKAVYGYFPCSFFLPLMMDTNAKGSVGDFQKKPIDEKIEWALSVGGEPATAATSSIVRHLLDKGFLLEYLLGTE